MHQNQPDLRSRLHHSLHLATFSLGQILGPLLDRAVGSLGVARVFRGVPAAVSFCLAALAVPQLLFGCGKVACKRFMAVEVAVADVAVVRVQRWVRKDEYEQKKVAKANDTNLNPVNYDKVAYQHDNLRPDEQRSSPDGAQKPRVAVLVE